MENKYKYIGGIPEHRKIAEERIGRFLKTGEVVHHINGIKADNRPKNLMVFASCKYHLLFHSRGRCAKKGIVFDGRKDKLRKLKQPKIQVQKGINIDRKFWDKIVEEKKRTDKSYKLIIEELIGKYLGKK